MADNELDLFQWQVGTQTLFATAVTPTAKLIGVSADGEIAPIIETSAVREERATLAPTYSATVDSITGEATVPGDANYEQIAWILDSLLGQATPGSGPGYARQYSGPIGTKPSPRILTLTRGSALDARCLKGAIANELTLTTETNKRVTYEAKFIGHSVEADALASLADITPNYIHANQAAITLDTWAGTMGATALPSIAYNLELGLNMNKGVKMGIGSASPRGHKNPRGEGDSNQLKLSVELDTDSAAYYTSILSGSLWQAQVQITYTLDATHSLVIQYAGYASEAPKFASESDGIATLDLVLSPMYHPTVANWLKITLTNAVSTL